MALDFVLVRANPAPSRSCSLGTSELRTFRPSWMMYASCMVRRSMIGPGRVQPVRPTASRTFLFTTFLRDNSAPLAFSTHQLSEQQSAMLLCFWPGELRDGYRLLRATRGRPVCPLNCNHVWGYAQTTPIFFPEIARNMRPFEFQSLSFPRNDTPPRTATVFHHGRTLCASPLSYVNTMSSDNSFLRRSGPT